jgi:hypothetical protein
MSGRYCDAAVRRFAMERRDSRFTSHTRAEQSDHTSEAAIRANSVRTEFAKPVPHRSGDELCR